MSCESGNSFHMSLHALICERLGASALRPSSKILPIPPPPFSFSLQLDARPLHVLGHQAHARHTIDPMSL